MAEISEIRVEAREKSTKGAVREIRRSGRVPAVIYGRDLPPRTVSLDRKVLEQELGRGGFQNRLYNLKLDDLNQRVLPREVQFHVVTDAPLHVDFLRLDEDAEIRIMVPVRFINEEDCVGLRQGGVLNVVRHEIEVNCRADAIPESIPCDLTGVEIGESIHISSVTLPDGVAPTIGDRDFTIATLAAPTVHIEETEEEVEEGEFLEGEEEAAAEETTDSEEQSE